jgi:hypothetical protein
MQATWDLRQLNWEPAGSKFYMLFLLLVWTFAGAKIFRLWWAMRRMRNASISCAASAIQNLQASNSSLGQWTGLTLLGWGLFASFSLGSLCTSLLNQNIGNVDILLIVRGYAATLTMALLTVTVLFMFHWNFLKKIQASGGVVPPSDSFH